ncbi:MAG: crotonase/enoyl-CoA hydratase family protein [Pseudomonadota bacterium]
MNNFIHYEYKDSICHVTLDDGKVNCFSPAMMREFNSVLDQADKDGGVILMTGREGKFSAGFDLKVQEQGPEAWHEMAKMGAELAARVFATKRPVVVACNGHAFAMASFILCAATLRYGLDGPFKIGANEVAIGKAVPSYAIELMQHRLSGAYLTRAVTTAELFSPSEAAAAGFLDFVVSTPEELAEQSLAAATRLAEFPPEGYQETSARLRDPISSRVASAIIANYG